MDFGKFMFLYGSPALAVLICILNLTEIILLLRRNKGRGRPQRSSVPAIFLMNLAVSDFSVGLTVITVAIMYYLLVNDVLPTTKVNLRIYEIVLFIFLRLSLLASVFNLMALTVDRLVAVQIPLRYRVIATKGKALLVASATWFLSSAFAGLHYYLSYHTNLQPSKYERIIFPAAIFPSTIAFTICYICILRKIFIQGREMKRLMSSSTNTTGLSKKLFQREKKISKLAGTVVGIFMVCWLPLAVAGLISICDKDVKPVIMNPMFVLAFSNSAIDPLVYFGFKLSFGKKIKNFFISICPRRRQDLDKSEEQRTRVKSVAIFGCSSTSASHNNNQIVNNAKENQGFELEAITLSQQLSEPNIANGTSTFNENKE